MSRRGFFISATLTLAVGVWVVILPVTTTVIGPMSLLEAYWFVVSGGYGLVTFANWRAAHHQVETARQAPVDEIEVEQALLYRFLQSFFLALHVVLFLVGLLSGLVPPSMSVTPRTAVGTLILAGLVALPVGLGLASVEIHIRRRTLTQLALERVRERMKSQPGWDGVERRQAEASKGGN